MACGQPRATALATAREGAFLIANDVANVIWRVAGAAPAAHAQMRDNGEAASNPQRSVSTRTSPQSKM